MNKPNTPHDDACMAVDFVLDVLVDSKAISREMAFQTRDIWKALEFGTVDMPYLSSEEALKGPDLRDELRTESPLMGHLPCEDFCQRAEAVSDSKYGIPAGYVSDLVDGARFTVEDPDDVAIAVFTRPQVDAAIAERMARDAGIARREMQRLAEGYHEVIADHNRLVRELDVLLNGEAGAARQASLCDIVSQVQREGIRSTAVYWHIPHTLAGFVAGYYSQYRCEPTSQDVWDAGFRAARDLLQPFKPQSMDDAIAAMPRYTTPLLDQGVSGLTPEYELHGYLVYETKFGGHWEFHPKDELPAGDFLKHREHKPIYVLAK